MTLREYESNRPEGEHKLVFDNAVVRVSEVNGEIRVVINRRSAEGYEQLPLGYILGSNYAIFKPSK